jgi:hypothetical protein
MVREMGRRTFVLKAGRIVEEIPEDSTTRWRPTPRPTVEDAII